LHLYTKYHEPVLVWKLTMGPRVNVVSQISRGCDENCYENTLPLTINVEHLTKLIKRKWMSNIPEIESHDMGLHVNDVYQMSRDCDKQLLSKPLRFFFLARSSHLAYYYPGYYTKFYIFLNLTRKTNRQWSLPSSKSPSQSHHQPIQSCSLPIIIIYII
jgi:hypothetical protein